MADGNDDERGPIRRVRIEGGEPVRVSAKVLAALEAMRESAGSRPRRGREPPSRAAKRVTRPGPATGVPDRQILATFTLAIRTVTSAWVSPT